MVLLWDAREPRAGLIARTHLWQPVGDALVAIDAGLLAAREKRRMRLHRALALPGEVHRVERVAVAAFERIVGGQPLPLVLRELEALVHELLARVDGAEDLAPHFLR